jgi:hypothetical protein
MALPGLVAANNLSDLVNIETAWNNIGANITATVSGAPATITIKGRDIFALKGVHRASTADFVRIKGLTALAQPRITTASVNASSGTVLRDAALLKASPVSEGDYYISRGALNGGILKVNGIPVASISGSPFSGDTASVPLLISSFGAPANFRFSEPMSSGVLNSPERAIPIETDSLILYIKAGQS